jgi:biotin operon repressor
MTGITNGGPRLLPRNRRGPGKRPWSPRIDRGHFRRGAMPNVFGTIERTEIVVFFATYGWRRFRDVLEAFEVDGPTISGRLADAVRVGLLQHVKPSATRSYYALNRSHAAYLQIRALGRRLGQVYRSPKPRAIAGTRPRLGIQPLTVPANNILIFSTTQSPVRTEILLLLAAVRRPIPVSDVGRVLGYPFYAIWRRIQLLDTMGIVQSTYVRNYRLVEINTHWPAYRELRILLRRLRQLDPEWDAYAAGYRAVGSSTRWKPGTLANKT